MRHFKWRSQKTNNSIYIYSLNKNFCIFILITKVKFYTSLLVKSIFIPSLLSYSLFHHFDLLIIIINYYYYPINESIHSFKSIVHLIILINIKQHSFIHKKSIIFTFSYKFINDSWYCKKKKRKKKVCSLVGKRKKKAFI